MTTAATVSGARTFTTGNWSTARTVTGVDDTICNAADRTSPRTPGSDRLPGMSRTDQSRPMTVSAELTSMPAPGSTFRWLIVPSSTIMAKR